METSKNIRNAKYVVTMPDGSRWAVPVRAIAESRADFYKDEFGGDLQRSLDEDTWPLFAESKYSISDWAGNDMNWEDVSNVAEKLDDEPVEVDYQEGWVNGEKEIVYPTDSK